MQKYLAALEQASLMGDLNEAVIDELDGVHYATMVPPASTPVEDSS